MKKPNDLPPVPPDLVADKWKWIESADQARLMNAAGNTTKWCDIADGAALIALINEARAVMAATAKANAPFTVVEMDALQALGWQPAQPPVVRENGQEFVCAVAPDGSTVQRTRSWWREQIAAQSLAPGAIVLPPVPSDLLAWCWAQVASGVQLALTEEGWATEIAPANAQGIAQAIERARAMARAKAEALAALAAEDVAAAPIRRAPPLRLSTSGPPPDANTPTLIALDLLDDNPYQPRLTYDGERITAIAASIREHGLLQVPVAREADGRYQLAFGHTRLRAYRQLAALDLVTWGRMPVLVRSLNDQEMALHAWSENKDRKDLTAYEEAMAIERYTQAFGWTQTQVAEKLGLDRSTVSNKLRLLRLPQQTLDQLREGRISERQAMALLPLMELPVETRADALDQPVSVGGVYNSLSAVLANPQEVDSTSLRRAVEDAVTRSTKDLTGVAWAEADVTTIEVCSASCVTCSLRMKSNRCPNEDCFTAKAAWWAQRAAQSAAASVGLPALVAPSPYSGFDTLRNVDFDALRVQATASDCGNLGVVHFEKTFYGYREIEGHAGCCIVCVHGEGKGKRCKCKALLERSDDPGVSAKAAERHAQQRIVSELVEPVVATFVAALAAPSVGVWRTILAELTGGKVGDNAEIAEVHRMLAQEITRRQVKAEIDWGTPDYERAEGKLRKFAEATGLPWTAPDVCTQTPDVHDTSDVPGDYEPLTDSELAALSQLAGWEQAFDVPPPANPNHLTLRLCRGEDWGLTETRSPGGWRYELATLRNEEEIHA